MKAKEVLLQILPRFIRDKIGSMNDSNDLKKLSLIEPIKCTTNNLRSINGFSLSDIFDDNEIGDFWKSSSKEIDTFDIPDGTGGVNPGDRRAIYYLICKLKPISVLEIGTHIGASTLHIASALFMSQIRNGGKANLTTLDIRDVNSPVEKPWLEFGTKYSPIELINKLNYGSFVNFIIGSSVDYFATSQQTFDFIFLDGDHSATTVYQEIPGALKLLNKNGLILLHDYFPKMKPLWSNGSVLRGPVKGTERLINEGADIIVLPLGKLPWPTKLGSNVTSLALLMRNS